MKKRLYTEHYNHMEGKWSHEHMQGKWSRECMHVRLLHQRNVQPTQKEIVYFRCTKPSLHIAADSRHFAYTKVEITIVLLVQLALFACKPLFLCDCGASTFTNADNLKVSIRKRFGFRKLCPTSLQNRMVREGHR